MKCSIVEEARLSGELHRQAILACGGLAMGQKSWWRKKNLSRVNISGAAFLSQQDERSKC